MNLRQRRLFLGGLFFAVMLFYVLSCAYVLITREGSYLGWQGYSPDRKHFYTTAVDQNGPTAMLQPDDELVAINGVSSAENLSVVNWNDVVPPGTPFTISVIRKGQLLEIFGHTTAYPPGEAKVSTADKWMSLVYLLFVITGLCVLILKPEDRHAWLLALMLGAFPALPNTSGFSDASLGSLAANFLSLARLFGAGFFPLFLIFFLNFPKPPVWTRKFKYLELWLSLPFLLIILPAFLAEGRMPAFLAPYFFRIPGLDGWLKLIGPWVMWTVATYTIGGLLFLVSNYLAAGIEDRKRLRVAILGSGAGFFSLLLLVLDSTLDLQRRAEWRLVANWLQTYFPFMLALVPLSFAYAIVRHRVIPISFIIRQGLRYLLVKRGATLLVIVALWLLLTRLLTSLFDYWRPSGVTIGWVSAIFAMVAMRLTTQLNQRFLGPLIDRKFFRQSYDAQQIIAELNQSIRTVADQPQLLEQVATRIQSALQTKNAAIFLRDEQTGNYTIRYVCDYDVFSHQLVQNPPQLLRRNQCLPAAGNVSVQRG